MNKVLKEADAMAEDPVTDMPEDPEAMADGTPPHLKTRLATNFTTRFRAILRLCQQGGDTSYDQILSLGENTTYF